VCCRRPHSPRGRPGDAAGALGKARPEPNLRYSIPADRARRPKWSKMRGLGAIWDTDETLE